MRRRITALAVLTATVAVLLFAIPLAIAVARYLASDERSELQNAAARVAASVSGDLTLGQRRQIAGAEGGTDVTVYDSGGARISGTGPITMSASTRSALAGNAVNATEHGRIVAAAPVSDGDTVTGAVTVSSDRGQLIARTVRAWAAMTAAALTAIAVSGFAARRYTRRLSEPLEKLVDIARQMGTGQRAVRASLSQIAELDTLATALNAGADRIEQTLRNEREFTANASHQLRTPLSGIRLELEAALLDHDSDARAAMGRALAATDDLETTITALLSIARDRPAATPVQMEDVLSRVRRRWTGRLAGQNRPLRIDSGDMQAQQVNCSAPALAEIIDVLLDNAERHGTGAVSVVVRAVPAAVAIDVSNEGPAITVPSRELFDRRNSHASGHGIGLSLARSLVEADGGRLTLTSADPPTFTVLLPINRDAGGAAPESGS